MDKSKNTIELWYLGKKYPPEVRQNAKGIVEFTDKFYVASRNMSITKRYLTGWYKQQARLLIQKRVSYFSRISGLNYHTMSITDAETRWGSCNSQKNLHFNWRLIMAPQPVIDYVISHELAHLIEMNHSRLFWEKVRKMSPLYRQYRTWLKRNGDTLKI